MTAPDQRAVPPPPPVADIWGAALADGSGRHVPVRRHWPELAAALDAEVDAAGMVPDTGQAREQIQRGRWTEERNALAGKLLDHLVDYEAALGRLPVDDVDGAMAVRLANVVLSAGWQPSGDTVQDPDAAAERQARYQETACARRPAEEHPDA